MNIGKALSIFGNLDDCNETIETKGLAIRMVIDMETHNSVTKKQMLGALNWMWNQIFELCEKSEKEGEAE